MAESRALQELFSRRLLMVSGKGGVGKTTVALALARVAAEAGKRVLLAGVETEGELGRLLERPDLGPQPTRIAAGLEACDLDADAAMRDFLRLRLKIRALADRVASNRAFAGFFTAAPGLREYVLLGKAWHDAKEPTGWFAGDAVRDLVILDAPATGHATAFLRAAHQVTDIMAGPLRARAQEIRAFLTNEALSALVLVATPEELAVNEAAEFYHLARRQLHIGVGLVVLNAVFPRLLDGDLAEKVRALDAEVGPARALAHAAQFRATREAEQARLLKRVRRVLPRPQIVLERLLAPAGDVQVLEAVARGLVEAREP